MNKPQVPCPTPAELPRLLVILGATASGKSELAAQVARHLGGEVVSCDSVAVFRGLEIGSAKPTAAQRAMAPHHMLDLVAPNQTFSAGDYARAARAAIAQISAGHKLPVIVGGAGLYLRALLEGLFAGPARDTRLRERLRRAASSRGSGYIHRLLDRLDPKAAAAIHRNDAAKVLRALEVCITTKQPMTGAWQRGRDALAGYRVIKIGLQPERALLYDRINRRAAEMFSDGLVEETRGLVALYGSDCWALQSLGYRQAQAVLRGEISEAEAIAATAQGHRNYAKRQGTWFRREPEVSWYGGFGEDLIDEVLHKVNALGAGSDGAGSNNPVDSVHATT